MKFLKNFANNKTDGLGYFFDFLKLLFSVFFIMVLMMRLMSINGIEAGSDTAKSIDSYLSIFMLIFIFLSGFLIDLRRFRSILSSVSNHELYFATSLSFLLCILLPPLQLIKFLALLFVKEGASDRDFYQSKLSQFIKSGSRLFDHKG